MKSFGPLAIARMVTAKDQEAAMSTLESALLLGDIKRAADIRRQLHDLLDKQIDETYEMQNFVRSQLK